MTVEQFNKADSIIGCLNRIGRIIESYNKAGNTRCVSINIDSYTIILTDRLAEKVIETLRDEETKLNKELEGI